MSRPILSSPITLIDTAPKIDIEGNNCDSKFIFDGYYGNICVKNFMMQTTAE